MSCTYFWTYVYMFMCVCIYLYTHTGKILMEIMEYFHQIYKNINNRMKGKFEYIKIVKSTSEDNMKQII